MSEVSGERGCKCLVRIESRACSVRICLSNRVCRYREERGGLDSITHRQRPLSCLLELQNAVIILLVVFVALAHGSESLEQQRLPRPVHHCAALPKLSGAHKRFIRRGSQHI